MSASFQQHDDGGLKSLSLAPMSSFVCCYVRTQHYNTTLAYTQMLRNAMIQLYSQCVVHRQCLHIYLHVTSVYTGSPAPRIKHDHYQAQNTQTYARTRTRTPAAKAILNTRVLAHLLINQSDHSACAACEKPKMRVGLYIQKHTHSRTQTHTRTHVRTHTHRRVAARSVRYCTAPTACAHAFGV